MFPFRVFLGRRGVFFNLTKVEYPSKVPPLPNIVSLLPFSLVIFSLWGVGPFCLAWDLIRLFFHFLGRVFYGNLLPLNQGLFFRGEWFFSVGPFFSRTYRFSLTTFLLTGREIRSLYVDVFLFRLRRSFGEGSTNFSFGGLEKDPGPDNSHPSWGLIEGKPHQKFFFLVLDSGFFPPETFLFQERALPKG